MRQAPVWARFQERGNLMPRGENFLTNCPGHEDDKRSLSIRLMEDGRVVVKCFAGCRVKDVAEGLECSVADFFDNDKDEKKSNRKIVATYVYEDEAGCPLYRVQRTDPKSFYQQRRDGQGWRAGLGDARRVLYHLPQLLASDRPVVIVEGEKDVENVERLGFIATTVSGGVEGWRPEFADSLRNRVCILVPDNDEPGRQFCAYVATFLPYSVGVQLPGLATKQDISDWIASGGTATEFRRLVRIAAQTKLGVAQTVANRLGALPR